ncbi:hypothetical protein WI72_11310 [Burkholderia ubonensis]|uniref:hypothetical protein n=1 Tax=Burkholderia ubonensis TaxID=101571 RepID=UPI00075679AC|nr:hypothetical protein [Burkholderia ubonensis]KVC62353.1 hypothetical protein WI72_11310 [Burkholderia ubonensis]KVD93567.1 hypothetical protein WI90_01090 [Burkholderia ubonensis]
MNTKPLLAVLLAVLYSSAASAQEGDHDACVVLQPTRISVADVGDAGDYPKDGWLGLAPNRNYWALAPAHIRFEPVQWSGEVVDVTSNLDKAIALFHCKPLKAGKIETANLSFSNGERQIEPRAKPLRFGFRGRQYDLRYTASGSVTAEGDGKRSILHDFGGSTAPFRASLIWAGDIDRDGRLDFLMEFESDIGANFCLFTSGRARERELVGRAGCMEVSG